MSNKEIKLLDATGIDTMIVSITKRGKKLDGDIQLCALSCLAHIEAHGDVRLFNRLYLAMPKGSRLEALTQWALAHGKVKANEGDNKKANPFVFDKDRKTDMANATKKPWYTFAKPKAPDEVFDYIKALQKIAEKAEGDGINADPLVANVIRTALATLVTVDGDGDEGDDE